MFSYLLLNKHLKFILLCLIIIYLCFGIKASENKIIFKINNKSFTSFDIEERKKYIYLINNNQNISNEILIEDYISTIIFYEYYKNTKMKIDLSNQINQIYKRASEWLPGSVKLQCFYSWREISN